MTLLKFKTLKTAWWCVQVKETERKAGEDKDTVVRTLGPGDFIGERALDAYVLLLLLGRLA